MKHRSQQSAGSSWSLLQMQAGPSEKFVGFCQRFWKIRGEQQLRMHERVSHLHFTLRMFQSLETEMVRGPALSLVSLPLWYALSEGRLSVSPPSIPFSFPFSCTVSTASKKYC